MTAKDAAAALNRAAASERYGYRLRGMASAAANRRGELVVTLSAPDRGLNCMSVVGRSVFSDCPVTAERSSVGSTVTSSTCRVEKRRTAGGSSS